MPVKRPTNDEMIEVCASLGLHMDPAEMGAFLDLMEPTVDAYNALELIPEQLPQVTYPRTPGYQPEGEENKYNAWYYKTTIQGAEAGILTGKTIVLKDNVCLAGVPMMNGASTLQGYVPEIDATIVTRILEAGGTILGKAHCEYFCFSGGSHTSALGPVINPRKEGHSAGGSSSGSAALVAAGEVDMAIGGDQGGSIRIPSSYCGVAGMKPTHGLVPYTGIMPIELTLDHTGPITATVADNALLLEALAGPDGLDPRQAGAKTFAYTNALTGDIEGLRIGVVKEGFGHPVSQSDVDEYVQKGAACFRKLGAQVDEVSIPMHLQGPVIWSAIAHEGATAQMMLGNGFGVNWKGLYVTSLMRAHDAWRGRADELSDSLKVTMMMGQYMLRKHRGYHYAKAQNLARRLRAAYDHAFESFDLLLMPTLPMKATELPAPGASPAEICRCGFEMLPNTCPFDVTGHPAMTIPCGMSQDLPVGMMLIGKHWDEETIYRAAHVFEQSGDWKKM